MAKDIRRNSTVCTAPDPSTLRTQTITESMIKTVTQNKLTSHQKAQLIFMILPSVVLSLFLQLPAYCDPHRDLSIKYLLSSK